MSIRAKLEVVIEKYLESDSLPKNIEFLLEEYSTYNMGWVIGSLILFLVCLGLMIFIIYELDQDLKKKRKIHEKLIENKTIPENSKLESESNDAALIFWVLFCFAMYWLYSIINHAIILFAPLGSLI